MLRAVSGAENAEQETEQEPRDAARNSRFPSPALRYWLAGAEGLPFSLSHDTACAACYVSGVQCKAPLLLTVCLVTFQPTILCCLCVWCILVCVCVLGWVWEVWKPECPQLLSVLFS